MAETNGNGSLLTGLPGWAKAIAIVGFPAVAAVYLTWLVGQALPTKLDAVHLRVQDVYALEYQHNATFMDKWAAQETVSRELISIVRATCVNAAKDEPARNRCLGR